MEDFFLAILEQNKETIFRLCNAYTTSHEDAKDLFQEVLINIWQALPSFQNKSAINTWAYRVTVNVCLRSKQKEDKRKKVVSPSASLPLENVQVSTATNGAYTDLYNCIRKLGDTDKSIIMLYLEDLSYKDIAGITGLTENHVAVKVMRIKTKLFHCLK